MPNFFALSARLAEMPEPGKATTPIGSASSTVRISGQLDAPVIHHAGAADLHLAGKIEDGAAIDDGAPGFVGCQDRSAADAETMMETVERLGRDEATDHACAVVGFEAVDTHIVSRQPIPDRQQQASDDVKAAFGEFRDLGAFGVSQGREFIARRLAPVRMLEVVDGDHFAR
jgi:hypothetical protein